MEKECLEHMLYHLDHEHSFKEKVAGYLQECRKNVGFETICIGVCEIGEFTAEAASYALSLPHMNELGLLGGTALGGAYAVYHTLRHGKKHHARASLVDAAIYAGSTESSCVISATGTEYLAGKLSSIPNNPFDPFNITMRLGALPIAFGLRLALMSAFTYRKKDEAGQCIATKNILPIINNYFMKNIPIAYPIKADNKTLTILGAQGKITMKERALPRTYHYMYKKETHALYSIHSAVCRYCPEMKEDLENLLKESFANAGLDADPTHEIFAHK